MSDVHEHPAQSAQHARIAVIDLLGQVIAEVAPAELPIVDGLRRDGRKVNRLLARRRWRQREPLGFGLDEVAVLATPLVWAALDEAVRRGTDGALPGLWRWVRRVLRKPSRAGVAAPLAPGQLDQVGRRVRELAVKAGMDTEQADVLADRVVAKLAAEPGDGHGGGG